MHRDILIVRNKTTNYNYWYIFHKPPCWAHADYSPLKQCCTLSKLVSFSFLQTCDTVICDSKHPTEQQERAKTFTSPSSCHPTLLHNVTLTAVRPPTRYFITLLTLLTFQWHTYFYLHDAIASFFCQGMALKQELGNEIGAQLILTSLWRWKYYLNT